MLFPHILYAAVVPVVFSSYGASASRLALDDQIHQRQWMPTSPTLPQGWLAGIIQQASSSPQPLHLVLEEFKTLIDTNARLYMLFESMFQEQQSSGIDDPGIPPIQGYQHMLQTFNYFLTTAPSWDDRLYRMGRAGIPFSTILHWPMRTPSGHIVFQDPTVNTMIQKMLDAWGAFLDSPASATVLGNSSTGWFGPVGMRALTEAVNIGGATTYQFDEAYVSDPAALYHGFTSWDDFFTREFRHGIRPIEGEGNDTVIVNACESMPSVVQRNVKARDRFWIKEQPYSVLDMLDRDPLAGRFIGGTAYQGFLTSLGYHRWHAPVSGTILRTLTINGTYFSEAPFLTLNNTADEELTATQYLATMATRSVIFIQADNPAIGVVAFVGVGMGEVSTCEITVQEGQQVYKGDQLGMFHFGGSTHCLVFEKGVNIEGFPDIKTDKTVPVRSQLAVIRPENLG
ncbi:hypothetical protein FE257_007560 [Aspergillus nanangensis]|uniref:L-tryptophan decarboxylase PsiD-like domain-containing protein n=1 Tax=Aspergillus nanangensis TaxID=2582783 RepID=A0AAD4CPD5_ASPNN|nr:hypothetical protein FE257_007560 [Aspergillus nanangensis]